MNDSKEKITPLRAVVRIVVMTILAMKGPPAALNLRATSVVYIVWVLKRRILSSPLYIATSLTRANSLTRKKP